MYFNNTQQAKERGCWLGNLASQACCWGGGGWASCNTWGVFSGSTQQSGETQLVLVIIWHRREACVQLTLFVPVQLDIYCSTWGKKKKKKEVFRRLLLVQLFCCHLRLGRAVGSWRPDLLQHRWGAARGSWAVGGARGSVEPMGALRSQTFTGCFEFQGTPEVSQVLI